MGVISTGAIFKTLTFDGRSSSEFNVYITGEGVFNAPERAVEMISIPGRNGAFALDNGRFENIEVTYNCGIAGDSDTDFAEAVSAFRNWLCSRNGYVRLSDDYNAGEYRMAIYKSGLEVTAENLKAGEFPIVFECKPQRFLTSGEEKITVGEWGETTTETGDIVEIENPDGILSVKSLTADINAEQDLNGYSSPWIHDDNEQTPYLFRSSNTVSEVGNSIFDTVVGGTLAVNQLVQGGDMQDLSYWNGTNSTITADDGGVKVEPTTAFGGVACKYAYRPTYVQGHKYLTLVLAKGDNGGERIGLNNGVGANIGIGTLTTSKAWYSNFTIANNSTSVGFSVFTFVQSEVFHVYRIMIFDLTQMFGSTIADYVYNLEQSTAGSGVAWLKQYYPSIFSSYQPFNAGSLESVEASEHVMTGFNQWDEEWEVGGIANATGANFNASDRIRAKNYCPCIGGETYYSKSTGTHLIIYWYDTSKTYIGYVGASNVTVTVPQNACYFRICTTDETTYNNDICINVSSDRNGEYEAYTQTSYPLDSDLVLRGIPKLDNGVPYYDGDIYESDGTVTRKYGVVDLGSLDYAQSGTAQTGAYRFGTTAEVAGIKYASSNSDIVQTKSVLGPAVSMSNTYNNIEGVSVSTTGKVSVYKDVYKTMSAADFKTAMSGVYLVYELATPTTETADTFTNPQVVYEDGTEEYVTTGVVPVGHVTDHANICPITGHDTVNVVVSPTTEAGDGTTYTTALGSTVYGGTLDIVSGELTIDKAMVTINDISFIYTAGVFRANNYFTITGAGDYGMCSAYQPTVLSPAPAPDFSINYASGYWDSNRRIFIKDSRFATVADFKAAMGNETVVYPLATPTTTTLTAQQVELLLGENNIWADTGDVAVEYGQNPNIIVNPTLFDSRPMLEITGYGNINLGSDTIEIHNEPVGNIIIYNETTWNSSSTRSITLETQYANVNDEITVNAGPTFSASYMGDWTLAAGTITSASATVTGNASAFAGGIPGTKQMFPSILLKDTDFVYGTSTTYTATASLSIVTSNYGTLTGSIGITLAYDGNSTFTLSRSVTKPSQFSASSPQLTIGDITLASSQTLLGNPLYVDLDIGEAYKIENDVFASINNGVVLPAELPTLAPGNNTITFDNTITGLDIVPGWFKI